MPTKYVKIPKEKWKTRVLKDKPCLMCKESFTPRVASQRYCGGHVDKSGCSWKNYLMLCVKKSKIQNERRKLIPDYHKNSHLKHNYNITSEDYWKLYLKQSCVCAICYCINSNGKDLSVDHDHKTGKIRGLLCSKCNFGLGNFNDDIELLKKSIKYLKKYANK